MLDYNLSFPGGANTGGEILLICFGLIGSGLRLLFSTIYHIPYITWRMPSDISSEICCFEEKSGETQCIYLFPEDAC